MNLKSKCAVCGHGLVKGQQTTRLMHGPRGFRSYAVCLGCAKKRADTQVRPDTARLKGKGAMFAQKGGA